MRTQPDRPSRQAPHGPTGAATRSMAVAALLLMAANHAQASWRNLVDLQFNTATSGNYQTFARINVYGHHTYSFESSVTFDNAAIGATQPPKTSNTLDPFGASWTELAANVTRTRTSSAYTVVPEITAAIDSSQLNLDITTNDLSVFAFYTDEFWLSNTEGDPGNKGLGFRWIPDPSTALAFPTHGSNNVNEMSLVFTPPPNANSQPITFQTTFGPGASPLEFNLEFPFEFGFNSNALYTMTLNLHLESRVHTGGNNQTIPDEVLLANIQPPGTVVSHPFGTLQVTDFFDDAPWYVFELPPPGPGPGIPTVPTPTALVLGGILMAGLALLGRRRSHPVG